MRSISGFSNSQLTIVSIRTTTGCSLSFKNKTADFTLKGLGTSENSRLFSKLKEFLKGPGIEMKCLILNYGQSQGCNEKWYQFCWKVFMNVAAITGHVT